MAGPTLVDHNATMYAYLSGCTDLMAAISSRLYGPPIGIPVGMTEAQACLLFSCDGGPGDRNIPMQTKRFVFYCYGATQAEAHTVFRHLFDALHRRTRTNVTASTGVKHLLSWGELETGPTDLPEPELDWPRVVATFRVRLGERATTW